MHVITLQAPQGNLRQSGGQDIFCNEAGLLQVKTDEASSVRPFEPKEYRVILAAVGRVDCNYGMPPASKPVFNCNDGQASRLWTRWACRRVN